jgi:hypothetical protein
MTIRNENVRHVTTEKRHIVGSDHFGFIVGLDHFGFIVLSHCGFLRGISIHPITQTL